MPNESGRYLSCVYIYTYYLYRRITPRAILYCVHTNTSYAPRGLNKINEPARFGLPVGRIILLRLYCCYRCAVFRNNNNACVTIKNIMYDIYVIRLVHTGTYFRIRCVCFFHRILLYCGLNDVHHRVFRNGSRDRPSERTDV